ncbi:4855_t:CDS:2, partial [Funneliformis geosporum]
MKFAITIFMLLAYVAIVSQAIGIKNGGGYVREFQAKHEKLMGDLRNTIDELDLRMEHWATAFTGNKFCKLDFVEYMEMKQLIPLDKWMRFHQYGLEMNQY